MLIFLFSIVLILFCIYYCMMNQKLLTQKTQLKVISRQNREFKSKISSSHNNDGPIVIKYKPSLFKTGSIKESCNLYLSPLESSPILSNLVKSSDVEIQDSAEIFNISWYEISLSSQTNINNKGWIKKDDINIVDDTVDNQ